jgi:hypothetical protein
MRARGKGEESVGRVEYTARTMRETLPALLDKPLSTIADTDVFAFAPRGRGLARSRARPTVTSARSGRR